jgi:hypothetical protein
MHSACSADASHSSHPSPRIGFHPFDRAEASHLALDLSRWPKCRDQRGRNFGTHTVKRVRRAATGSSDGMELGMQAALDRCATKTAAGGGSGVVAHHI